MADRRSLTEGLKSAPTPIDPDQEKRFVFAEKPPQGHMTRPPLARVPISTRMRSDFAAALKRASLERQLQGIEPNTLQDISEAAVESWLRSSGYVD